MVRKIAAAMVATAAVAASALGVATIGWASAYSVAGQHPAPYATVIEG